MSAAISPSEPAQPAHATAMHGIAELVSFVSSFTTLLPGDVILTGTPEGVGRIEPGDVVDVQIEGIGTLTNPVVAAE